MKDQVQDSNSRWYFVVDADTQIQFDVPLNFKAGNKYKVSVKALVASESDDSNIMSCYRVIGEGVAHFRAGAFCCLYLCEGLNSGRAWLHCLLGRPER